MALTRGLSKPFQKILQDNYCLELAGDNAQSPLEFESFNSKRSGQSNRQKLSDNIYILCYFHRYRDSKFKYYESKKPVGIVLQLISSKPKKIPNIVYALFKRSEGHHGMKLLTRYWHWSSWSLNVTEMPVVWLSSPSLWPS